MAVTQTLNSTEGPTAGTDDGVVAELKFAGPDSPPTVILSFQGTEEPVELWVELTRMGWNVPHCPPRPASAILWEPDPIAGTNYTIRPWRVKEFEIRDGRWPSAPPVDLSTQTYELLRQHGVQIVASASFLGQLDARNRQTTTISGPVPEVGLPDRVDDRLVAEPPRVIVIDFYNGLDFLIREEREPIEGLRRFDGVTGSNKGGVVWNDSAEYLYQLCPDPSTKAKLIRNSRYAWVVEHESAAPVAPPESHMEILVVIPGGRKDDSLVRRFGKILGEDMTATRLRPIVESDSADDFGVLISGVIHSKNYNMLAANMPIRMSKAILRGAMYRSRKI
jgi:hypothetical protein